MRLHFIPIHVFRETPSVTFFDAGVPGANGTDVVAHHGAAISPPDDEGIQQFYVHQHQVHASASLCDSNAAMDHHPPDTDRSRLMDPISSAVLRALNNRLHFDQHERRCHPSRCMVAMVEP